MKKTLIENTQRCKMSRSFNIRLDNIVSLCVGFLLIFVQPGGGKYFKDWLIPPVGDYRLSPFEAFTLLIIYIGILSLAFYGIRIKKYEKFFLFSIIFVILSRILSLLAAEYLQMEQWISVLRYVGGGLLIFIFANLFSDVVNRRFFIFGLIVGVLIESIGGLFIFLSTGAKERGIFICASSCILSIFLILACLFAIKNNKKHQGILYIFLLFLLLSIISTGTRTALILLATALLAAGLYEGIRILKPMLFSIILISMIGLIALHFYSISGTILERYSLMYKMGGTIQYRFYLWDKAVATFLQHPVTGIGSGGFPRQFRSLPQTFQIKLTGPLAEKHYTEQTHSPHHTLLGIASETGIVGLIAYFFLVITIINICVKALSLCKLNPRENTIFIAVTLFIIGLIGSELLGGPGIFFGPLSNIFIGFLLGYLRENTKKGGFFINLK